MFRKPVHTSSISQISSRWCQYLGFRMYAAESQPLCRLFQRSFTMFPSAKQNSKKIVSSLSISKAHDLYRSYIILYRKPAHGWLLSHIRSTSTTGTSKLTTSCMFSASTLSSMSLTNFFIFSRLLKEPSLLLLLGCLAACFWKVLDNAVLLRVGCTSRKHSIIMRLDANRVAPSRRRVRWGIALGTACTVNDAL